MPDLSANLSLPFLQPSQAQKHVTHNEALQRLDALVQLAVTDSTLTTPPALPVSGARYLIPGGAEGAWAGQEDALAVWQDDAWIFLTPQPGWQVQDLAVAQLLVFRDGSWGPAVTRLEGVSWLGLNATADAYNRLAVSAAASLLSHEGAGHQVKVNKAGTADTASLLFQSNWSGRAEMGLVGEDTWSLKVSADGSSWTQALSVDAVSGHVTGAAVQETASDVTPGRLARADYAYGRGNLLGAVGLSGGLPTGAVIERGSNASGDYVRFADGTQICTRAVSGIDIDIVSGALYRSDALGYDYPAAFVTAPAGFGAVQDTLNGWVNARCDATGWYGSAWSPSVRSGVTVVLTAIGRWG